MPTTKDWLIEPRQDRSQQTAGRIIAAALEAAAKSASRGDASDLARTLRRDSSLDVRLGAYEQLRTLDDVSAVTENIAERFHLGRLGYAAGKGI